MEKVCCDCRDGGHDNYEADARLVIVRDPDTGKIKRRGYMCSEHIEMYSSDGYIVETV